MVGDGPSDPRSRVTHDLLGDTVVGASLLVAMSAVLLRWFPRD